MGRGRDDLFGRRLPKRALRLRPRRDRRFQRPAHVCGARYRVHHRLLASRDVPHQRHRQNRHHRRHGLPVDGLDPQLRQPDLHHPPHHETQRAGARCGRGTVSAYAADAHAWAVAGLGGRGVRGQCIVLDRDGRGGRPDAPLRGRSCVGRAARRRIGVHGDGAVVRLCEAAVHHGSGSPYMEPGRRGGACGLRARRTVVCLRHPVGRVHRPRGRSRRLPCGRS